ncbi:ATP-binding protein [Cytophagia bacterium CHB2]|nr:ATP-binding protein [Cytophagia bacterium CHB2]
MNRRQKNISQSQPVRLLYLLLYLAFLFLINRLAFDQWLPLTTSKGLWFYSGAAAMILGSLLATPFFTSPANAISYLVAALTAILAFDVPSTTLYDMLPRQCVIFFCFALLTVCVLNIVFKDSKNRLRHNVAEIARILADNLGNPRFVYAIIIIFALWEYRLDSPKELFFVGVAGLVVAAQQPLESIGTLVQHIRNVWRPHAAPAVVGCMVAQQMPGLFLIQQNDAKTIQPGSCLLVADKNAAFKIGIALSYFSGDEGNLIRALEITIPDQHHSHMVELAKRIPEGFAGILCKAEFDILQDDIEVLKNFRSFLGIVSPETCTGRLYFEVMQEKDIEQGRLVETFVGEKRVLYQVLDGITKEKIMQHKNTYGFARGEAAQIGIWDEEKRKFKPCNWIPRLNTPVFLKDIEKPDQNAMAVGYLPSTNYEVGIKSLDELVTHNTAILGILGVGKSMLAIELVERLIKHGVKMICIDLTNQYATELSDFYDTEHEAECLKKIEDAGLQGRDEFKDNPDEGGSVQHLREAIYNDLKRFLTEDGSRSLKIYNPAALSATKQEQEPKSFKAGNDWRRGAALWQVTPVEITRIIAETCLSLLQGTMSNKARACLVFEEAHSLVPEWNSVASDGDKTATNGTARAILQGRKYGLGCLLITQRTANVTKTILNQCNTVFAMRTFDDTGKEFLSNYIGREYALKLPSLKERHAVFFGRASSCENPVMIRLNDQSDFRNTFRASKGNNNMD